jgi:hypothetical protein
MYALVGVLRSFFRWVYPCHVRAKYFVFDTRDFFSLLDLMNYHQS